MSQEPLDQQTVAWNPSQLAFCQVTFNVLARISENCMKQIIENDSDINFFHF
jgi:hypothetical protein